MSRVREIESAIEKLENKEIRELANWWSGFLEGKNLIEIEKKNEALRITSGCLADSHGEDFEAAVKAAGRDLKDSHEW